jgi:hypothetical protein
MSKATVPARSVVRDLTFGAIEEVADLAISYSASILEAAHRGDEVTLGVHIAQLRACFVELTQLRDALKGQLASERAAA